MNVRELHSAQETPLSTVRVGEVEEAGGFTGAPMVAVSLSLPFVAFGLIEMTGPDSGFTLAQRGAILAVGAGLTALGASLARRGWFALVGALLCGPVMFPDREIGPLAAIVAGAAGAALALFVAKEARERPEPATGGRDLPGVVRVALAGAAILASALVFRGVLGAVAEDDRGWPLVFALLLIFGWAPFLGVGVGAAVRRRGAAEALGALAGLALTTALPGPFEWPTHLLGMGVGATLGAIGGAWARRGEGR